MINDFYDPVNLRNLVKTDLMGGKADAIVHVSLGDKEHKTKCVKENNNPEINETFRFPLPAGEKTMHTLYMQVFDWDRFSKNDPIGEVAIYLGETNLADRTPKWQVLQPITKKTPTKPKPKPPAGPARIHYQVQYNKSSQALQVNLIQAEVGTILCSLPNVFLQNLGKADLMGGAPDSYVSVYLLPSAFKVKPYLFKLLHFCDRPKPQTKLRARPTQHTTSP